MVDKNGFFINYTGKEWITQDGDALKPAFEALLSVSQQFKVIIGRGIVRFGFFTHEPPTDEPMMLPPTEFQISVEEMRRIVESMRDPQKERELCEFLLSDGDSFDSIVGKFIERFCPDVEIPRVSVRKSRNELMRCADAIRKAGFLATVTAEEYEGYAELTFGIERETKLPALSGESLNTFIQMTKISDRLGIEVCPEEGFLDLYFWAGTPA